MEEYDVIVIGGGPAGMMAVGRIIECTPSARVLLIEKNKKLGEKLSITGGGRCNITHAIFDTKELLKKYGAAEKFLHSTFAQFSTKDTFNFFEKRNLPIVTQANNRAFPKSEKASDVTKVMIQYCTHPNITIKTNTIVKKIHISKEECHPELVSGSRNNLERSPNKSGMTVSRIETTKGERYSAKSYILATGGLSHPETGSTGDGFAWLKDLGHIIKQPTPTLVPWKATDIWIHDNSGNTINECKITVTVNDKKYFSCTGKILCTHTGLSGPLILNNSSKLQDALYGGDIQTYLDIYPNKNHKELDDLILSIFEKNKNKKLKNVLSEITQLNSFESLIEKHVPYDIETTVHSVSKEFRKSLVHLLKKIPITVTGLEGYEKSIVADGGISLSEINMKTMQSQKISNLYITGDLLDIRRPSGGFSLQLCWTTGYVAGTHCVQK
jgi:predicted Rossmann fold flavoprotein